MPKQDADPLDAEAFDALRRLEDGSAPGFLGTLIRAFLDDTNFRLGQIRAALDAANVETAEKAAHALKGSCGNIGALGLARLMEEIVEASRAGQLQRCREIAKAAKDEFARVERRLKADLDLR